MSVLAAAAVGAVALISGGDGGTAVAVAARQRRAAQTCETVTVTATAGKRLSLKLRCRRGRRLVVAAGRAGARWQRSGRVRAGVAVSRTGVLRLRPVRAGVFNVRYRVRVRGGARYVGLVRVRVAAGGSVAPRQPVAPSATSPAAPEPAQSAPTPVPSAPTPAPGPPEPAPLPVPAQPGGLPAPLPDVPRSVASSAKRWQPTAVDTCSEQIHDRFSVVGPDGKRYPAWHPPSYTDPATGSTCTFGHEHGLDPARSDLNDWVAEHFSAPGLEAHAGIPFGLATEALDTWSERNPGTVRRSEDHVGYKIDYANDVELTGRDNRRLGVTCDELVRVHQGSHSADATVNNVHELLYAVRCDDGTELISNTVARFGAPGQYTRSCDGTVVATRPAGYPAGRGGREIPDRACVERNVLVPAGRTTSAWALYEKWSMSGELTTSAPGVAPLASFDAAFGVFDPSRYARPGDPLAIGRTLDTCWESEPSGDRANGYECGLATAGGQIASAYPFTDLRSPFNGTYRDTYTSSPTLANAGGARRWWTDPYGGNASRTPFPGAICQLVGAVDNERSGGVAERVIGRNRDNEAPGVHAPN